VARKVGLLGFSRRSLRWAVPTTALAALLAWGVVSGGIGLGAPPAPPTPAGPPSSGVIGSGGPLVLPLPTDHLRTIGLVSRPPDDDAQRLTWHLFGKFDGGRRLALIVTLGCGGPITGASVAETPRQVTLTVYGPPRPRGACTAQRITVFRSVRLPDPLGQRVLRHG
jgi:hypothetical protein